MTLLELSRTQEERGDREQDGWRSVIGLSTPAICDITQRMSVMEKESSTDQHVPALHLKLFSARGMIYQSLNADRLMLQLDLIKMLKMVMDRICFLFFKYMLPSDLKKLCIKMLNNLLISS